MFFEDGEIRPVEPGEFPAFDAAMDLVARDLAATEPQFGPLSLSAVPSPDLWDDDLEVLHVDLHPCGRIAWGLSPSIGAPLWHLADRVQDHLMEDLWRPWPECPTHRMGTHLREDGAGRPHWWCPGRSRGFGQDHFLAAVGELATVMPRSASLGRRAARRSRRG